MANDGAVDGTTYELHPATTSPAAKQERRTK